MKFAPAASTAPTPRSIRQPGPVAAERAVIVPSGAIMIDEVLPSATTLLDGVAALLSRHGLESACLSLSGGAFAPFAYVIPARAHDESHAAFYSDVRRPDGHARLDGAAITVGSRAGRPHFHCHGLWTEANGRPGCGHVLPDETTISEPIRVEGAGLIGARFELHPDAETGFDLFEPRATGTAIPAHARRAIALRLRPNQDVTTALEQAGCRAGFQRARLHGGVASLIGARFTDAPAINGFATELFVRSGSVRCAAARGKATALDITIVDLDGAIGEGRLIAGDNPVLITFEGVLAEA